MPETEEVARLKERLASCETQALHFMRQREDALGRIHGLEVALKEAQGRNLLLAQRLEMATRALESATHVPQ